MIIAQLPCELEAPKVCPRCSRGHLTHMLPEKIGAIAVLRPAER